MKFKVGDKVRYDRDFLIDTITTRDYYRNSGLRGFKIVQIEGEEVRSEDGFWFHESHLELIPEKCKFEYGEVIEVTNGIGEWVRAIFVMALPNTVKYPFICVKDWDENSFHNGSTFYTSNWEYARKLQPKAPQITRKEIAHKLGISEDFVLIDKVIIDGI